MRTVGLRDDNDQGSLINSVNYVGANCGSIPAIPQTSVLTNETAVPFYFLAYDLTTNGLGSAHQSSRQSADVLDRGCGWSELSVCRRIFVILCGCDCPRPWGL